MATSSANPLGKSQKQGEPLHNLPLPVFEELIGREAELAQLYELLSPQSGCSVISH